MYERALYVVLLGVGMVLVVAGVVHVEPHKAKALLGGGLVMVIFALLMQARQRWPTLFTNGAGPRAAVCDRCGEKLRRASAYCPHCGQKLHVL